MEEVILVDEHDNAIGTMEKMEAHRRGALHRAYSVLIFNTKGELLLQQRAAAKYHSGLLWTNTCCSHPRPGEAIEQSAQRRLLFEMGIDTPLSLAFTFIYRATLDHDLIEHEFDYVFTGTFDGDPEINRDEVENWRFVSLDTLREDVARSPESYTQWFRVILERL